MGREVGGIWGEEGSPLPLVLDFCPGVIFWGFLPVGLVQNFLVLGFQNERT